MTVLTHASTTARVSADRRWRAMGTDAHLIVVGVADIGPEGAVARAEGAVSERLEHLVERAVSRVAELEGMWSRFLPTSEVSALNRTGWAVVSPETFALIDRAVLAWRRTDGRFDPTRLRDLEDMGYDRSFDQLAPVDRPPPRLVRRTRPESPRRAVDAGWPIDSLPTGCAGIVLDPFTRTVIFPTASRRGGNGGATRPALAFDPGGIGKGYAADLVVQELLAAGAAGALMNLGGDLRVEGVPPSGQGWMLEVGEAAWSAMPLAVLELERGAVATSTPLRRRWAPAPPTDASSPLHSAHHLLDPSTGRPTVHGPAVVTAIAGHAWWAEAVATATAAKPFTDPPPLVAVDGAAVATVSVGGAAADGSHSQVRLSGGFEKFMATIPSRSMPGARSGEENEECKQ